LVQNFKASLNETLFDGIAVVGAGMNPPGYRRIGGVRSFRTVYRLSDETAPPADRFHAGVRGKITGGLGGAAHDALTNGHGV
jgi:hypothetical protein